MQVKRTRTEIIDIEKRYYNNFDQTANGFSNFWKTFLILLIILIVIILFVTCYRYIYGQIIYMFKRCITRQNENTTDGSFCIIKETESSSYIKQRFLWPNKCNFSKFHMKYGGQRNKPYGNKCKLKTLLQEKKKLLAPCENKIMTSTDNTNLIKQLSLKTSFSSFSSAHANNSVPKTISKEWDSKNYKNYKRDVLSTRNIKNLCLNSYENDKDVCFSDTDLKFLVIPLSSERSNIIKDELLLSKWNSGNVINHSRGKSNTSSKLIELKFENMDSFSDNTQKYRISTSKSNYVPYSSLLKNVVTDSKYFSDSAAYRSDMLPNILLNKFKRSTNSYTRSTLSSTSNLIKTENHRILNINSKIKNPFTYTMGNMDTIKTNGLKELKSQVNLSECKVNPKKIKQKMKSSIDILPNAIKEVKNPRKWSKSDKDFSSNSLIKNDNSNNITVEKSGICTQTKLTYNNENVFTLLDHKSEITETFDELGILFSQYIKLQNHPCQRKYCPLKRHLKQRILHSTKKCQMRFKYCQMYPYDQRPICNSGNVCIDTYDEFKLMYTIPTERKHIYQCMSERRKHFLNHPCYVSN